MCRNRDWSRPRDFMSRQSFPEWCRDRVFCVTTEFGQDSGFSCRDRTFLCRNRVGQGEEILCRNREFDVETELPLVTTLLVQATVRPM